MLQLRRVIFSGVLLAVFLAQHAGAALLPTSSWTGGSEWQGSAFYSSSDDTGDFLTFDVRVDYAVYKTDLDNGISAAETTLLSGFIDPGYDPESDDNMYKYEYIYAYQVLTRNDNNTAVGSFSLFDGDDNPMGPASFGDITAIDDDPFGEGGIEPAESGILPEGIWNFENLAFKQGANSWYLVYGSDEAPVVGNFSATPSSGLPTGSEGSSSGSGDSIQPIIVPEPMSILLLGSGFFALRRRRK